MGSTDRAGILLVEDNWDEAVILREILEKHGYAVTFVADAGSAEKAFARESFEAVLSDIRLPGRSGLDLLKTIRRKNEEFPVILFTGFDDIGSAIEAVRLGAHDYVLKPFDAVHDLIPRLKRAIRNYRLLKKNQALQEQLAISEAHLRTVMCSMNDLVLTMTPNGKILFSNVASASTRIWEESIEPAGRLFADLLPSEVADLFAGGLKANARGGDVTFRFRMSIGGRIMFGLVRQSPLEIDGRFSGCVAVVRDITDTVEMEKALLEAGEREQQRVARDLHGSLGQQLVGVEHMASFVARRLAEKGVPELGEMEKICNQLREAVLQVRRITMGLSPVEVSDHGLSAALRQLCANTTEMFKIRCVYEGDELVVDEPCLRMHLYYMAREAVGNAVKHGDGGMITVRLSSSGSVGRLVVENTGASARKGGAGSGVGLEILKFRASVIGAALRMDSEDGITTVTCDFDLPQVGKKVRASR